MANDCLTFEIRPNGDLKIMPATHPQPRSMTVWTPALVRQANEVAVKLMDDPLFMEQDPRSALPPTGPVPR